MYPRIAWVFRSLAFTPRLKPRPLAPLYGERLGLSLPSKKAPIRRFISRSFLAPDPAASRTGKPVWRVAR